MTVVKSRRDMYAEATRAALIQEATNLFAQRGFAATSLDDVARAAHVTRGAVYHHFAGKHALFSAVVEVLEKQMIERVAAAMTGYDDVWDASMAAIDAFVDACLDPVYSTVVWREGMSALGWEGLKVCAEEYSLGLIEASATALIEAGYFQRRAFDTTVRLVFHMFGAAAMTLASAEDKQRVRDEVADVLKRMFSGLRLEAPATRS
jgi:AcrR family transcriptional regulator